MKHNYKPNHGKKVYSNVTPILLIAAGLLIILTIVGLKVYTQQQQKNLIEAYVSASALAKEEGNTAKSDNTADTIQAKEGIEVLKIENKDEQIKNSPVCLLKIPKINLTVAVVEGVDNLSLRYAVGHSTDTAMPGQNGNFCVFGHRNYVFGEYFNRLGEIKSGDSILVDYNGGNYTYIVTDILVVEPSEIWVLDPTPDARITLVTCTPVHIATHRLIIKGVLKT
jgi:sortase A